MPRLAAFAACGCACAIALVQLQARQTPPPQTPQTPAQQPPVFRGEIDVIRLDVSVLDKDRHPVRGLTAADFTVLEDGKPQRLIAVSEVDAADLDPAPSAWMRHVTPDIATNDLNDQVGDGRVFAIVMDDRNIPWDDLDIIMSARNVGRYIIDGLGPSDVAAVVYPRDAGLTQDFTSDRSKLLEAVERFDPQEPDRFLIPRANMPGQGGADMPYRASSALMRNDCERGQPTVPTLGVLTSRLATIPNRRKTIILVSVGIPLTLVEPRGCPGQLADEMRDTFRAAQRASVNIYGVDPAGFKGYEEYLQKPIRRGGRPAPAVLSQSSAQGAARLRRDFLEITAEYTGARAVVGAEPVETGIDRIFGEDGSYYLVGYQTSNGKPDGKFRRVDVKVARPGVTVRTRSGYYAPKPGQLATPEDKAAPGTQDLGLSGMMSPAGLGLRASVVPVALVSAPGSRNADVAIVLTARLPASGGAVTDTLTITRNVYDADGKAGPPVQEKIPVTLPASGTDGLRLDTFSRLALAPGRYQIRLNAYSTVLQQSGSVFADVEVPDFTRSALTVSGISLGTAASPVSPRTDPLAALLPIVPTSAREFSPSDAVVAFCRVYQGGSAALVPVSMKALVLDVRDQTVMDVPATLTADAFATGRAAPYQIAVPLDRMTHGPHVLSLTATLAGGTSVRRDLVFRVR
jgi:VWFA-related protein